MAIQDGIFPLKGTIGNVTFVRGRNGVYRAQRKTSIDKTRIMTDPFFQRTRENLAEFARAGKAGSFLREVFKTEIKQVKRERVVARLLAEMMKVVKLDLTNPRGQRQVLDAETELLQGFQFNIASQLKTIFGVDFTTSIDRVTGVAEIEIPSFVPSLQLDAPESTTHFKFIAAAAAIGFEDEVFTKVVAASAPIEWNTTPTGALSLTANLPANATQPLFLLLGINFLQDINGTQYPLKNGAFNSLGIVKVLGV
jgi:hypothetical protein